MILNLPVWLGYILLVIFGLALGSYINSWLWRIHENKWKWGGRSECVHCGRRLAWFENIPLFSFVALKGKCRTCGQKIPFDYWLVELALGLGFVGLTYFHLGASSFVPIKLFRDLFFFAILVVVFVYDFKYQLVLSGVVWSGTIIAFIINYFVLGLSTYSLVLGVAVGGGFFLVQYVLSKGRWIGGGDVRLGVMMGALLGWPNILVALFVAYVGGAMVSLPLLLFRKKGLQSAIPFGTFLAMGTLLAMLWGGEVVSWYLNLIRW